MTTLGIDDQTGVGQLVQQALAIGQRRDVVLTPPHDEHRLLDQSITLLQSLVPHGSDPGQGSSESSRPIQQTLHILDHLHPDMQLAPDWLLGLLFGAGGFAGIYCGARCQKYIRARYIKWMLCLCILAVAAKYLLGFFRF